MLVLVGVGSVPNLPRLFDTNQKWYIFTLVTRSPKTPYFDMNQKWHIFTFVAHIINTIEYKILKKTLFWYEPKMYKNIKQILYYFNYYNCYSY